MHHLRTRPAAIVALGTVSWTENCYGGVLFVIGSSAAAGVEDLGLGSTEVASKEGIMEADLSFRLRRVGRRRDRQRRGRTKGLRHLKRMEVLKLDQIGLTRVTRKFGKRLRLRRGTGLRHGGGGQRAGEELTVGVVVGLSRWSREVGGGRSRL